MHDDNGTCPSAPRCPDCAASLLEAECRKIAGLAVHGVGVAPDVLYVYCRAKKNAQQRIPKEFEGRTVKYVLCKVAPAGAQS